MRAPQPSGDHRVAEPDPLHQAIWNALSTAHQDLAVVYGHASRYPAPIAPFAALDPNLPEEGPERALKHLCALFTPGETFYLLGERPLAHPGLQYAGSLPCLQMIFPEDAPLPGAPPQDIPPVSLTCDDADAMLSLINVAYPGFFRCQTCRLGRYWGLRDATSQHLIAMGGERLVLTSPREPAWREISGLCSDPAHPGRGLGTTILRHVLALHRTEGSRSWLQVSTHNTRAVALYQKLGFVTVRSAELHRLERIPS